MSKGKRGGFDTKTFKRLRLLSITKLQNLKAIHNPFIDTKELGYVVINHKITKFESNLQLDTNIIKQILSCYQSQNYKI